MFRRYSNANSAIMPDTCPSSTIASRERHNICEFGSSEINATISHDEEKASVDGHPFIRKNQHDAKDNLSTDVALSEDPSTTALDRNIALLMLNSVSPKQTMTQQQQQHHYQQQQQTHKPQQKQHQQQQDQGLTWQIEIGSRLSDWIIFVSVENGNKEYDKNDSKHDSSTSRKTSYHVHKSVVGAGKHRSEYFEALFKFSNDDLEEETRITSHSMSLNPSAAATFPAMLDHVYTGSCNIRTENVVALRSLAKRLMIRTLLDATSRFLRDDMKPTNAIIYLSEAAVHREERIAKIAIRSCAAGFDDLCKRGAVHRLSPRSLRSVLESDTLDVPSERLSIMIADYFRAHEKTIDGNAIASLTDPEYIPRVHNSQVLYFLNLCSAHGGCDKSCELSSLKKRCIEAVRSWKISFGPATRSTDDTTAIASDGPQQRAGKKRRRDDDVDPYVSPYSNSGNYAGLPDSVKVEFMEAALLSANRNFVKANERIALLTTQNHAARRDLIATKLSNNESVSKLRTRVLKLTRDNVMINEQNASLTAAYNKLKLEYPQLVNKSGS